MTGNKAAVFAGNKIGNEYAAALGDLFNAAPKTVLAAIAVSFATSGGDHMEVAREAIRAEWNALFVAGVVRQAPPPQ